MKRQARIVELATLFALALLLSSLTACGGGDGDGDGDEESYAITVDSAADTAERDGVLTLREAVLIVTGELAPADLDEGEADNVTGSPGAVSSDAIVFDPSVFPDSEPVTISLSSDLPSLSTGNDTVDGSQAGVIVDGGGRIQDLTCFHLTSNGNMVKGLQIQNCRTGLIIEAEAGNNTIGGSAPGERNIISGNVGVGIEIDGVSNVVVGNYIGTDPTGTESVPNHAEGIWIAPGARDNVIGGSTAEERNVISGNRLFGVRIGGAGATGNVVKGNYVGVDATGREDLFNDFGVVIDLGAQDNIVGGSEPEDRNIISGNGGGILIRNPGTTGNVVQGNYIGTDPTGRKPVANAIGVLITQGTQDNVIGGIAPGEGNLISASEDGVFIEGPETVGNTVRGNSIYANRLNGIRIKDGANADLEAPVITSVSPVSGTACPGCTVDVYSDSGDQGEIYEGSTVADEDGRFTFTDNVSGPNITAVATDSNGNTSAFSEPAQGPIR